MVQGVSRSLPIFIWKAAQGTMQSGNPCQIPFLRKGRFPQGCCLNYFRVDIARMSTIDSVSVKNPFKGFDGIG
jgi:hypothetical protein